MDVIIWNSGAWYYGYRPIFRSLGAYKAAQVLRQNGYNVQIIDFVNHLTIEQLYLATIKFITGKTICLGISATFLCHLKRNWPNGETSQLPYEIYQVLKKLRKERPFLKIVLGGYNSDIVPNYDIFDGHILGYAEDIFYELVNYYRTGKNEPIYKIDTALNRKAYIKSNRHYYRIENDSYRFVDNDCIMPGESLPIEIARGCVFKCKFCNHLLLNKNKNDYLRDLALVKQELQYNYYKWGTTNYFITCNTFNDTQEKISAWYKMIQSLEFDINFVSYLRADLLDRFPDTPYMLHESGLAAAFHGIESLHPIAAKSIGKEWSGSKARDYIPKLYHDIWQSKVYQHLNFIIGLPEESRESILDTADWFKNNNLYSTEFAVLAINKNWSLSSSEFSRNYSRYGYSFKDNSAIDWYNNYWSFHEANEWKKNILKPYIIPFKGWFGPWQIIGLQTLGYNNDIFDKSRQTVDLYQSIIDDVNTRSAAWIQEYLKKILSL